MGFLSFLFGTNSNAQSAAQQRNSTNAGHDLRLMMLTTPPARTGGKPTEAFPRVYGILMDWPISGQTATVFSTSSGAASLYTTSTFGIIDGEGHESVRPPPSLDLIVRCHYLANHLVPNAAKRCRCASYGRLRTPTGTERSAVNVELFAHNAACA
jgi:hypothetical protein